MEFLARPRDEAENAPIGPENPGNVGWNAMLFPLMVLTRKLFRGNCAATSDVKLYPRVVERLCRAAMEIEGVLLGVGLRFPFGGSIIAIAVRSGAACG
jgi:hypothetical protein